MVVDIVLNNKSRSLIFKTYSKDELTEETIQALNGPCIYIFSERNLEAVTHKCISNTNVFPAIFPLKTIDDDFKKKMANTLNICNCSDTDELNEIEQAVRVKLHLPNPS